MGIFGALTTAVGGLRANSYALENVSGNIANSQTTAFKRVDTSFLDLIPQTSATAQLAGGVTTQSRSTNSVQGDVQSASVATFMAASPAQHFAIDASYVLPRMPASTWRAAWWTMSRAAWTCMAMSASMNWMPWKSAIRWPNCRRSLA